MNYLQNEIFSRRGAETQRKSVLICVYPCSSVAQKALIRGAAL
jgi:hypothetical protein